MRPIPPPVLTDFGPILTEQVLAVVCFGGTGSDFFYLLHFFAVKFVEKRCLKKSLTFSLHGNQNLLPH